MRHRAIFVFFALLLTLTSILAPMPDAIRNINITGSGGQLGLGEASAADLSPVTVDATPTTDNAISYSNQRQTFYGASRFWDVYSNGTNLVYKSSLDGTTWSSATTLVSGLTDSKNFSLWWDSTYIHFAYSTGISNADLHYRRGLPDEDGTIALGAEQNAVAADAAKTYLYPFISKDTSGYPVISYTCDNTDVTTPYVAKSAQNNGQWTSNTFDTQLSATDDDNWRACVLPTTAQDLMALYARDGQPVKSKTYDFSGTAWASENTTTTDINVGSYFSAVVTSDNVVHLVLAGDAPGDLQYTHYHSSGTSWQAEEALYTGSSGTMAPVLSKTLDDNLYCFWMGDNVTDHIYYKAQTSGTWDTTRTDWLTESGITDNASISCAYEQTTTNYIPVIWLTGASSPYNVRFAALERTPAPWLSGWEDGGRAIIYNDGTHITSDQDNFTITINVDNTTQPLIFSELGSPDNRRKIAVTIADGVTELEVEIERWNPITNSAVLHCGPVATLHDIGDTYYLYYDSTHIDNPKVLNDRNPAVWNSDYQLVMNMENWNWEQFKNDNYTIEAGGADTSGYYNLLEPSVAYVAGDAHPYKLWMSSFNVPADEGTTYYQHSYESDDGIVWSSLGSAGQGGGDDKFYRAWVGQNSDNWTSPVSAAHSTRVNNTALVLGNTGAGSNSSNKDTILYTSCTASATETIYWIQVRVGGNTNVKATIYSDNAGIPKWSDCLGGTTGVSTACVSGLNWVPLQTPARVTSSSTYWIAYNSDASQVRYENVGTDTLAWTNPQLGDTYGTTNFPTTTQTIGSAANYRAIVSGWRSKTGLEYQADMTAAEMNDGDATAVTAIGIYDASYPSKTPSVNDATYIGGPSQFNFTKLDVGTAGVMNGASNWVFTWEYYSTDNVWVSLSGVSDGTNSFTTAGVNSVTFTLPGDWKKVTLGVAAYYIRARVSSTTAATPTTIPTIKQAWTVCKYWAYGIRAATYKQADLFTSPDPIHFDLDTANVLHHSDTDGDFDYVTFGGFGVWAEGSTLYMNYMGCDSVDTATLSWLEGNATSTADSAGNWGRTWTKQPTPATDKAWICEGFPNSTNNIIFSNKQQPLKIGSRYYVVFISTPANTPIGTGTNVTDVGLAYSDNLSTWYAIGGAYNPFLTRTEDWEYPNSLGYTSGVMSNPWLMEVSGYLRVYYNVCHDDSTGGDVTDPDRLGYIDIPLSPLESFNFPSSMLDSSTNENDPNGQMGPVATDGFFGEARLFNGTNSYLRSSNVVGIDGATDFTMEAVVQITDNTTSGVIFGSSDSSGTPFTTNRVDLDIGTQHFYLNGYFGGVQNYIASSNHYGTGSWYYIAGVRSGTTWTLYVYNSSGTQLEKITDTKSGTALDVHWWSVGSTYVGAGVAAEWVAADIDMVRFSDVAFSEARVESEANNFFGTLLPYSETSISVSPTTWTTFFKESAGAGVSSLRMNDWYTSDNDSNIDFFTLSNTGGSVIDCLISSSDNWIGTGVTWDVSPTGDPGDHTIGIWAGLDSDSDYVILVKPDDPANFLLTALAAAGHDHFGLKVFTCTSNGGNASMSGTITLTAVVHT